MLLSISTHEERNHYVALINGGWWGAHATTKDGAIRAAIRHFERETGLKVTKLKKIEVGKPTQLSLFPEQIVERIIEL